MDVISWRYSITIGHLVGYVGERYFGKITLYTYKCYQVNQVLIFYSVACRSWYLTKVRLVISSVHSRPKYIINALHLWWNLVSVEGGREIGLVSHPSWLMVIIRRDSHIRYDVIIWLVWYLHHWTVTISILTDRVLHPFLYHVTLLIGHGLLFPPSVVYFIPWRLSLYTISDDYDNLRNLAVAGIILQALYLTKLAAGNRQIAEKSIWFDFLDHQFIIWCSQSVAEKSIYS